MRLVIDRFAERFMRFLTFFSVLIVFFMALGLYWKSRPILAEKSIISLMFSNSWHPLAGRFGFFPFIIGTIWVTGVAVIIAVPLCILTASYLSEYAPLAVKERSKPFIDLLAGIPSIVYGMWGVLVIVPLVKRIASFFDIFTTGYSILAGGLILSVMIIPVILHVSLEVFSAIPYEMKNASLSLGATKWQTVKHVVFRKGMPGIIAAIVLGLSRAFGETMAVMMVVGNVPRLPSSVFDPAYPLPALIANNYGEMLSIPLYDSALLLAALILFLMILVLNIISRIILIKIEKKIQ